MAKKNWVAGALAGAKGKHPLRATAKKIGMISGGQSLSAADLDKLARSKSTKVKREANLAKTLKAMHK